MRSMLAHARLLSFLVVVLAAAAPATAKTDPGPPVVRLVEPADETVVVAGTPVTFSATALGLPDNDLTGSLVWTSSLDGELGRGGVVTRALSAGTHRIRATATSSDARQGTGSLIVMAVVPTMELTPDVDTYVDGGRRRKSFERAPVLYVDGSPERWTLFSFTVSGVGSARVERAILRLTVARKQGAGGKAGGDLVLLDLKDTGAISSTLATLGRVRPGQVVEIDVTSAVQRDGKYGFALLPTSGDGVAYRSQEAPHGGPRLVLTLATRASSARPQRTLARGIAPLAPGDIGYEDFVFGSGVDQDDNRVTGQKPESKLWFQDGRWWATLWQPSAGTYRIHWLDLGAHTWVDSGVAIDERPRSRQDVLQAGGKLYIASRFAGSPAQSRLYRFSYVASSRTWARDAGFPVNIPGGGTESMTIARDSRGVLWIAYTLDSTVLVSHTTGSDTAWATPFAVPVPEGTDVDADDIAAVTAFSGNIGVFWSNQSTDEFYFAVHADGASSTTSASAWKLEVVASGGHVADDHLCIKLASDGRLFVAVKTSKTGSSDTLVGLFVRAANGGWSPLHNVTTVASNPTRPILLLDEQRSRVMIFYSADQQSIRYKESDLNTVAFPSGSGTAFIESAVADDINNPTSTKQNLTSTTGLVVLASSPDRKSYWHNAISPVPSTTTTTSTLPPSTTVTSTTSSTSRPPTTVATSTTSTSPPTTLPPLTTTTSTTRPPTTTTTTTVPRHCIIILGLPVCL